MVHVKVYTVFADIPVTTAFFELIFEKFIPVEGLTDHVPVSLSTGALPCRTNGEL